MTENHNAPFITVGELSASVKRTLESAFDYVRVKGEISRPSFPASGHVYFSLKDESHNLGAVVWKGVAAALEDDGEGVRSEGVQRGEGEQLPLEQRVGLALDQGRPA